NETNGVLQTNGSGLISATNGTDGQLLIGGGASPQWANLTSSGNTVIITEGPNSINLESTGGISGWAGLICFYAYQGSHYGVPNPGALITPVVYQLGYGVALTVNVNEGSAFYPGDGSGSPATFTAPSKGIYKLEFATVLSGGQLT